MEQNIWLQYANVFIPLGISLFGMIVSFYVHKEKVKTLTEDVKELKIEMKEIRDKVISCETSLRERGPLTQKKSPVSLSERGVKFLNDSGGKQFVDDNFQELLEKVEKKNPKTAYDIQEESKQVIDALENDDRLNPLKEFLYNDGSPLSDLTTVMGIYLRDKLLKHKNWRAEDIDKQTTNHETA